MNRAQKILTLIFIALFAASVCWFPWIDPKYDYIQNHYPVWLNYGGVADWARVGTEWLALAVVYAGLWFVLARRES